DEISAKLTRLAPDFESWGSLTEFAIAPELLLEILQQYGDRLFRAVVQASNGEFLTNQAIFGDRYPLELDAALRELQRSGAQLSPELQAVLHFVRGRDAYVGDRIDEALDFYQQSLAFWQHTDNLQRQGINLYHIALAYGRQAELDRDRAAQHWQQARHFLEECIAVLQQGNHPELVAKFIVTQAEILRQLQAWDALQTLANSAVKLPETHGNPGALARDYGFLAEVALHREKWMEAKNLATKALEILESDGEGQQRDRGLFLLLLARSLRPLSEGEAAVECLEKARDIDPQDNPPLYIEILEELRSLYYEKSEYRKAFQIKQERRSIEQQFGFRAFMGAGRLEPHREARLRAFPRLSRPTVAEEIIASGRETDLHYLIERIGSTQHKLTVIHGQSGVGKSSLVKAGLLPALNSRIIGDREVLPVALHVYGNWVSELGQRLNKSLAKKGIYLSDSPTSIEGLIEQLRETESRHLLTVLIFDQLEEFFFGCRNPADRLKLFCFLGECLNLPFVKVVLSLREDYLHFLLIANRFQCLSAIDNDILNKAVLYPLGNFSPKGAKDVIDKLTQRAQFHLESALVDTLVRDLSGDLKSVRPIELQVVGAQLQMENITTLAQYRDLGENPKKQLVQRYLEEVVRDCGPENKKAAELILYLLTGENNTRPLKTRSDIERDLKGLAVNLSPTPEQLNLILYVFVRSGLVFMLPESPAHRYQLVHDYLVGFLRHSQADSIRELQHQLKEKEEQVSRLLKRQLQATFAAVIILLIIAGGAVGFGWQNRELANQLQVNQQKLERNNQKLEETNHQLKAITAQLEQGKQTLLEFALQPESQLSNVLDDLINEADVKAENYQALKQFLIQRDWENADRETYFLMLYIAGNKSYQQGYFDKAEYENFSCADLKLIDDLWYVSSGGTQGFRVRHNIYRESGQDWEQMYDRVGWRKDNRRLIDTAYDPKTQWFSYPDWWKPNFENPPEGHLPYFYGIAVYETPLPDPNKRQFQIQDLLDRCEYNAPDE
ncbi:nSTAND1 domain-containing NTPase, partial [Phormidium sp. CCY1219]|uniref:nSTAND1 domain-containing NTPase n=1 Tax=Phormidium sp. CCY1219 TaxID=2886104 RepID=UPI002D1EF937